MSFLTFAFSLAPEATLALKLARVSLAPSTALGKTGAHGLPAAPLVEAEAKLDLEPLRLCLNTEELYVLFCC